MCQYLSFAIILVEEIIFRKQWWIILLRFDGKNFQNSNHPETGSSQVRPDMMSMMLSKIDEMKLTIQSIRKPGADQDSQQNCNGFRKNSASFVQNRIFFSHSS